MCHSVAKAVVFLAINFFCSNLTYAMETEPTLILDFKARKNTWPCFLFPLKEVKKDGDPNHNLFAADGPLHNYDRISGGNARQHELVHNRKAYDSSSRYAYWGHDNEARQVACIFEQPKHGVTVTAADGTAVYFSERAIQGLLVKIVPHMVKKVDCPGELNPFLGDQHELKPEPFVRIIKEWAKDGMPFVLDISEGSQVLAFACDKVSILESDQTPQGFNFKELLAAGEIKYYKMTISGIGFNPISRSYEYYIQRDGSKVIASGWIKKPFSHKTPDFIWRPHPIDDLKNKDNWKLRGKSNNPFVDPQIVYGIYMKSLE
jgi:hypothetical protein